MQNSPRGHQIRKISGNGSEIMQRGTEMESLGTQMLESAEILKLIKGDAEGKGFSIKKIRDNVGDLHIDLAKAGERYKPSGTVLRLYGEAVVDVKLTLNQIVDECTQLWAKYESANEALTTAGSEPVPSEETPAESETRTTSLNNLGTSKNSAYNAWHDEAVKYDAPYDTWDTAYNNAAEGLKEANEGGVKDRWWDNALPFIEAALVVLAVAGVILAVLAIVIGGAVIALLAAIVGLVVLGMTIWKVCAGRGGKGDIALAVVGIIPFGRLGQLGGVFKGQSGIGAFAKGFGSDMAGLTQWRQIRSLHNLPALVAGTPVRNAAGNLTGSQNIINAMHRFGRDMGELPYRTPAGWLSRITGGGTGQLSEGMRGLYGAQSPSNIARMNNLLSGTPLEGMRNAPSTINQVGNVIDSVVKPSQGGVQLVGTLNDTFHDVFGGGPADQWEAQLTANK